MKNFTYVIRDPYGIHVRAAGTIVKEAKKYNSIITLHMDTKNALATRMLSLMNLGVKCGDCIKVDIIGSDETAAFIGMKDIFEKFL